MRFGDAVLVGLGDIKLGGCHAEQPGDAVYDEVVEVGAGHDLHHAPEDVGRWLTIASWG